MTAGGPQVQPCSMQGYLQREVMLLRTMLSCVLSFSKECISKDGAFPLPGLHHSPSGFFFSPYVQAAFPLLQISAIASWPFPGHLRAPGSIHSLARPQVVKGSNYPPPLPALYAQLRHDITTLVGLWYQLPQIGRAHV